MLALLLAAQPAHSTDLVAMRDAAGGLWDEPAHWCALLAFALVIVAETGRQPVDNPDTHLELTMIHEGPLLEYAGRDLAYLQWAAAARHWVVLVLAAELFLPRGGGLLGLAAALLGLCASRWPRSRRRRPRCGSCASRRCSGSACWSRWPGRERGWRDGVA